MRTYQIALYPGDGIGTEVLEQAVRVLEAVEGQCGDFHLEYKSFPWGGDYYVQTGQVAPPDFLDTLRPFDAIFLGALGDPRRIPDHITLVPLIRMRQGFDQYACVRPARLYPGVRSLLAGRGPGDVDLVVVRENSEGEYVDNGGRFKVGRPEEFAVQSGIHTRKGIERILRFGFQMARSRRKHLTMVTKSNALKYGMVLWDEVFEGLKPEYPDVTTDKQHVDACSMSFVRNPDRFDVVVASNLFGDILSDLAGALAGGLGTLPSANINPDRTYPSMFEPVHGSAPDIMGRGIANPVAAILAGAMMLDWLGQPEASKMVNRAVETTLAQGHATSDLGGKLRTEEMTERVIDNL